MRDMDAVFRALGDPARRRLLDRLNERNGLSLTELCAGMGMTRQSVTKHLAVLEAAGLVATAAAGPGEAALPERRPHQRHRRPLDPPLRPGAGRGPVRSQDGTGGTPPWTTDDQTTFVYTTYIHATPERVWQGLTDPAFTTRYWRHPASGGLAYVTDWQKGSTYDLAYEESGLRRPRPRAGDPRVRSLPPAGLHLAHLHARMGRPARLRRGDRRRLAGRAPLQGRLRHRGGRPGRGQAHRRPRRLRARQSGARGGPGGWPAVIASLKTLLETGSPLP